MTADSNRRDPADDFVRRHVGPSEDEILRMARAAGFDSLDALVDTAIPSDIRLGSPLALPSPASEAEMLRELAELAGRNRVFRSFLGLGYHGTNVPAVIRRNVLENPGWYTQYTPYQPEISQGRLEALLNFQTMVADLTALPVANASLLDEATAAAEAMALMHRACRDRERSVLVASSDCHPQTLAVVRTRAEPLGLEVRVLDPSDIEVADDVFGVLLQYPASDGAVRDPSADCEKARAAGARVAIGCDLLALTLLRPPGELGADIAYGNSQRFGVPLGYGGPHAAFFATRDDLVRQVPGRIIGVSRDARGRAALRMALQTREQHIRREKATSNICTAQALLAIIAGAYAVYHGPDGLRSIARRVNVQTRALADGLRRLGCRLRHGEFFDTLAVEPAGVTADQVVSAARERRINLRKLDDATVGVALDETVDESDLEQVLAAFAGGEATPDVRDLLRSAKPELEGPSARTTPFMEHAVFHSYRSETDMQRYLRRLESRDLSLTTSMIPLGSCTMKLNAAAEMLPITWPEIADLHPFAPTEQAAGYREVCTQLEAWLAEILGLPAVSLQPNSGASGEHAGLLVIRQHHRVAGAEHRDVCLIPSSAHGTNPASASMAGLRVVVVRTDDSGNVDLEDLKSKAAEHSERLAALMVTYPSTHGVFEETIREICDVIHEHGGQVYLDGANLNAQVGLCRPGDYGADVCHVNLHKTFCIPHGGGGPGMGPIGVAAHLADYLPTHPLIPTGGREGVGPVAAAPWGSPSILPISWAYVRMMGSAGLTHASKVAILSANYVASRLRDHYPVLYTGLGGTVAHECIIDLRQLDKRTGISAEDVAKRLMDFGFHAPTMSWPVAGTLMIEPTESESQAEIDRFCDAMIAIRQEIEEIAAGRMDREDNPLKNAPHAADVVTASEWDHPYSREQAAFPAPWTREHKFWPPVSRVDNAWGDRNLNCTCPPPSAYEE